MRRMLVLGVAALLITACFVSVESSAAAATCGPDVIFVGARGSGETPQAPDDDYVDDNHLGLGDVLFPVEKNLESIATASGITMTAHAVHYPAISVTSVIFGDSNDFNLNYNASVSGGAEDFAAYIASAHAACSTTQFILGGYSQGAQAIGEGIDSLTTEEKSLVVGTVLFGDPKFNPDDSAADLGTYRHDRSGIAGSRATWSSVLGSPVFSFCDDGDVICNVTEYNGSTATLDLAGIEDYARNHGSLNPFSVHSSYNTSRQNLKAVPLLASVLNQPSDSPPLDVALVFDTSDSTSVTQWDDIRTNAQAYADAVISASPGARVALVDFKGNGDGNDYVSEPEETFTRNDLAIDSAISAISLGGGTPNASGDGVPLAAGFTGLAQALALPWRDYAFKQIVLFSGSSIEAYASPEGPDTEEDGSGLDRDTMDTALEGIRVDSIVATDNSNVGEWQGLISNDLGGTMTKINGHDDDPSDLIEAKAVGGFTEPQLSVSSPDYAETGATLHFSADAYMPDFTDSAIFYSWEVDAYNPGGVAEVISRGDQAMTTDASVGSPSFTSGPTFSTTIDEPGTYTMSVGVETTHGYEADAVSEPFDIYAAPQNPPHAPALKATLSGDTETLSWPASTDPTAHYTVADASGDVIANFTPSDPTAATVTYAISGIPTGSDPTYTVSAVNDQGSTPAVISMPATSSNFQYKTDSDDAEFTIQGDMTPLLQQFESDGSGSPTNVALSGSYDAVFSSDAGETMHVPMADSTSSIDFGDATWTAHIALGDVRDASNELAWQRMQYGLASKLQAGGSIQVVANGKPVLLSIDDSTSTTEAGPPAALPPLDAPVSAAASTSNIESDSVELDGQVTDGVLDASGDVELNPGYPLELTTAMGASIDVRTLPSPDPIELGYSPASDSSPAMMSLSLNSDSLQGSDGTYDSDFVHAFSLEGGTATFVAGNQQITITVPGMPLTGDSDYSAIDDTDVYVEGVVVPGGASFSGDNIQISAADPITFTTASDDSVVGYATPAPEYINYDDQHEDYEGMDYIDIDLNIMALHDASGDSISGELGGQFDSDFADELNNEGGTLSFVANGQLITINIAAVIGGDAHRMGSEHVS